MPRHRFRPVFRARRATAHIGATQLAASLPNSSITFPTTALGVFLYVAIGQDPNADPDTWLWTLIPPNYILWRDKVRTRRGRSPGQTQASPSTLSLSLKNAQGRYSWGRGTPMRLDVDAGMGARRRFTGFVVTMNPKADTSGNDRWLTIQAAGILQRLGRHTQPAHSATWDAVAGAFPSGGIGGYGEGRDDIAFWWALEDGPSATSAASALIGGPSMTASGVTFSAASGVPAGITTAPNLAGGRLSAIIPAYPALDDQHLAFYFQASGACTLASWTLTGIGAPLAFAVLVDGAGTASLTIDGVAGLASVAGYDLAAGEWHKMSVQFGFSAGTLSVFLQPGDGSLGTASTFYFGVTSLGNIGSIVLNPLGSTAMLSASMLAGGPVLLPASEDAMNGDVGQGAMLRFVAVCQAEGTPFEAPSSIPDSDPAFTPGFLGFVDVNGKYEIQALMGARQTATQLAIFRDCETAEDGFLYESLEGRVRLDWHDMRENQPVGMTLHVGTGGSAHVLPAFEPVTDDQRTINDATVMSSRDTEEFGPLGVDQAGRYDASFSSVNLQDAASDALNRASYEAMRGTRDEPRFDSVGFSLAKSPDLASAWLDDDPLSMHTVIENLNGTIWLSDSHQIIEGYEEIISQNAYDVVTTLTPEAPYRTFVVEGEENLGRLDNPDSTLVGDLSDDWTITTIQVASPSGLWRTGPAGWPLCLAGNPAERVEVVSVAGASSPQTFTITRHQGKTVPHLDGSASTLWRPGVLALHERRILT